MEKSALTKRITATAIEAGASIAGVADLWQIKDLPAYDGLVLDGFRSAVSYAVALPGHVFEMITASDPGRMYAWAYKTANQLLDLIGMRVASTMVSLGGESLVVPSSMKVDVANELGHVSHKAFALAAGIGWIGRNNLLVTPGFGPRVRLGTVLTDLELEAGIPMDNKCGDCRLCILSCPSNALSYREFKTRPESREDIFDSKKCSTRLSTMKELLSKKPGIGDFAVTVCGMCIKVCPYGKRSK
ncbi:MAG: epoxyqueuosine reductase [Candidatus Methanosuratus sp.]|nr:epoxyqueuosine reductase [Candidatus Methanosuratincola sp.]